MTPIERAAVAAAIAALEQADRYIHQMGIPDKWGRHIMAKLTAALALIGEG